MRREGRQRGWVRVYDRALVDPEGKRPAVRAVDGPAVANGGFIRASRRPTNQSKPGGLRALGRDALAQAEEEEPEPEPQLHPPLGAGYSGYYCTTTCQSPFKFEAVPYQWRYDAFVPEEVQAPRPPPAAARFGGTTRAGGVHNFGASKLGKFHHSS
ncbi:unnamed protein product [Triticum turgidum subsp. durum]|uniref:Uncharacterized protein n=1 Tax=Triticum turgidum subsp. durum TaxID=4567 RepID=A0A9R0VCN9_TRITD|nr:unnamed protein product [Triticum turgidum subsp. durum]